MARCKELFGWDEKYPVRDMGNGKVRTAGVAMAMQGSGISGVDVGSATIKLSDEGFYNLSIGAADMGTGCDTILAQMAAECLDCSVDDIAVFGADSDASPYDSGSYASSTTYVTGKAVEKACAQLKEDCARLRRTCWAAAQTRSNLRAARSKSSTARARFRCLTSPLSRCAAMETAVQATASHSSPVSPPPFMVGMVEIELDKETGQVDVVDYVAVVDCGTPVNPALARVQTEGGLVQGIGMALFEDVTYEPTGTHPWKTPLCSTRFRRGWTWVSCGWNLSRAMSRAARLVRSRLVKSSSTRPRPALAHAIAHATGVWHRELPITPEKVLWGIQKGQE